MKFNLDNYLLTGAIAIGTLFSECSQIQQETNQTKEKTALADSIHSELKKYSTTTHFIYEIQKNSDYNFNDVKTLEKIISNVESKFPKKQEYSKEEAIKILNTTDKEIKSLGLEYNENKFDCDDISFIYLAVGEKLNLPLYGVSAPQHLFIRYDKNGKHNSLNLEDSINNEDFNWETTYAKICSDEYYKEWLNISEYSIEKKFVLKNLTKLELIALACFNKGNSLYETGGNDLAIQNYNKAIELDPNDARFHYNKGNSLYNKEEYNLAIQNYDKAIELNPNDANFYSNKGNSLFKTGEYEQAIQNYDKAIELNSNDANFYHNKQIVKRRLKQK